MLICEFFFQDIEAIGQQVAQIEKDAAELRDAYAGDKAVEIASRESEVVKAWRELRAKCDSRSQKLGDTNDLFRFLNMVRDLLHWMEEVKREMSSQERPKVSIFIPFRYVTFKKFLVDYSFETFVTLMIRFFHAFRFRRSF